MKAISGFITPFEILLRWLRVIVSRVLSSQIYTQASLFPPPALQVKQQHEGSQAFRDEQNAYDDERRVEPDNHYFVYAIGNLSFSVPIQLQKMEGAEGLVVVKAR